MAGPGAQLYLFPTDFFVPPLYSNYDHRTLFPPKDLPLNVNNNNNKSIGSKIREANRSIIDNVGARGLQGKQEKNKIALKINEEHKLPRAKIAPAVTLAKKLHTQDQEALFCNI